MIAHLRPSDGARQSLSAHSRSACDLAGTFARPAGLEHAARLAALIHDMGKGTPGFRDYLVYAVEHPDAKRSGPAHAPAGAIFAHERWFGGGGWRRLTAQLISMAVLGHHAGLPDCLNAEGTSAYLTALGEDVKREIHDDEAARYFLREVAGEEELDGLFEKACGEVRAFFGNDATRATAFRSGMLARLILSAVVDADRWDSAAFERGEAPGLPDAPSPDWADLLQRLEAHIRTNFNRDTPLNELRAQISETCALAASGPRGIYTLTVPTGGGKTLASLRFALAHAASARGGLRHIFYIIPFNTILDQNADEIRRALGGYEVLEHHSGVVTDSEEEYAAHRRLTERWDEGIILTSVVQFLNALFRAENTDARRMRALAGSVLVFDEIQALPKACTRLFEEALRFLTEQCGATALILTATQPRLALSSQELIRDVPALFEQLRRVEYRDESRVPRDDDRAAEDLAALLRLHGSVLAVVNTKRMAQTLFDKVRAQADPDVRCAHLSTLMCPAHRMAVLEEVKALLRAGSRVFLVSTQLIEAGVNLSFPAVVRSLASLPSIIQAGGRCNRNAEIGLGTVYIWRFDGESLGGNLGEIRAGQRISDEILRHLAEHPAKVDDPAVIDRYFEKERAEFAATLPFPYRDGPWTSTLLDMLSTNEKCVHAAKNRREEPLKRLSLPQSFRTACRAFQVIAAPTRGVLAPYREGEAIIEALAGRHDMREEIRLLRKGQRFSVNVYEPTLRQLADRGALIQVGETGALALRKEFYGGKAGARLDPGAMDFLEY